MTGSMVAFRSRHQDRSHSAEPGAGVNRKAGRYQSTCRVQIATGLGVATPFEVAADRAVAISGSGSSPRKGDTSHSPSVRAFGNPMLSAPTAKACTCLPPALFCYVNKLLTVLASWLIVRSSRGGDFGLSLLAWPVWNYTLSRGRSNLDHPILKNNLGSDTTKL
ncbi:hypothetical protein Taro_002394 [Colocasia esculenta]|uniref:Uncharacterized protein n=1 Tax=Colocasia esculenta TaxID=4460 RepID=A0A843TIM8_COLES|nr:hypothetical protein [Colocasia esculenta]